MKIYEPGTYFGKVKFLEELERKVNNKGSKDRMGLFQCYCGNKFEKLLTSIVTLNTTSCGCLLNKNTNPNLKGCSYTPEYKVWNNFKNRCTNPKAINYHRYGGRGISFCEKWSRFEGFLEDMGKRPSKLHSLDRIDNDKNYCKENCKWVVWDAQTRNRSTNKKFIYKDNEIIIADIMKMKGMTYLAVMRRINAGLSIEEIINLNYNKYERILPI